MLILSIDTSCDETAAAVTDGTRVLSNTVWSQASLHAKRGGVMPSLAKREHEARIDFIVNHAISNSKLLITNLDAIAVTQGPGLVIALEVGIAKAKELARKYNKPLIPVNHIEGHLLSPLVCPKNTKHEIRNSCLAARRAKQILNPKSQIQNIKQFSNLTIQQFNNSLFPALGLVASGGTTQLILVEQIGKYKSWLKPLTTRSEKLWIKQQGCWDLDTREEQSWKKSPASPETSRVNF